LTTIGQLAALEPRHDSSFGSSSTEFFNSPPQNNAGPSNTQFGLSKVSKSSQSAEQLQQRSEPLQPRSFSFVLTQNRLRVLDARVELWIYIKNALKSSEITGLNDQSPYGTLQMLQLNIGKEIKVVIEEVESLGDQAVVNGEKHQAEVAYTRLIKTSDRLNDPDFGCICPLLRKMVGFYERYNEPFQAKEILRRLSEEKSPLATRYDPYRLLANAYQETSKQIAKILQGLNLGATRLNVETPCPPFHCALQDQTPKDVLNIMAEHNDIPDILRRQNIHVAIEAGREDLIDNLVNSGTGSVVNARDVFRRTPLHLATQFGCTSAFDALVMAGADRKSRDASGQTILELAARVGSPKMVATLLDKTIAGASADVNDAVFFNTSTPLQAAAEEGHTGVVDILLDYGAKVSKVRQYDGKTAAQIALERGYPGIADRLIARERSSVDPMLCLFGPDGLCG
jgi:ankyrin repeat protein